MGAGSRNESGKITEKSLVATLRFLRVKYTAGGATVELAGAEFAIGYTETVTFAALEDITIVTPGAGGTRWGIADAAITKGAAVGAAAAGEISATVGAVQLGFARQAATAAGDLIEYVPLDGNTII